MHLSDSLLSSALRRKHATRTAQSLKERLFIYMHNAHQHHELLQPFHNARPELIDAAYTRFLMHQKTSRGFTIFDEVLEGYDVTPYERELMLSWKTGLRDVVWKQLDFRDNALLIYDLFAQKERIVLIPESVDTSRLPQASQAWFLGALVPLHDVWGGFGGMMRLREEGISGAIEKIVATASLALFEAFGTRADSESEAKRSHELFVEVFGGEVRYGTTADMLREMERWDERVAQEGLWPDHSQDRMKRVEFLRDHAPNSTMGLLSHEVTGISIWPEFNLFVEALHGERTQTHMRYVNEMMVNDGPAYALEAYTKGEQERSLFVDLVEAYVDESVREVGLDAWLRAFYPNYDLHRSPRHVLVPEYLRDMSLEALQGFGEGVVFPESFTARRRRSSKKKRR